MNEQPDQPPSLSPDDPRISEWLDGRLPAAEAAVVERAVRASPTLVALVADLRAMKDAARAVAAVAPPADFADRVLAAAATGGSGRDPDRAVDDEWRAIEAARIAEERAEAVADIAEAARDRASRRRWPWLALAGALAAGLLVTVVLNRPMDEPRELALARPELAAERAEARRTAVNEGSRQALPAEARARGSSPASAPPPVALGAPAAAPVPAAAREALPRAADVAERLDRTEAATAAVADAVAAVSPSPQGEAAASSGDQAFVEVVVWGAEGRAALARRIAALGLVARPPRAFGGQARQGEAGAAADLLEILGPPEAIATFLGEVAGWEDSEGPAAGPQAAGAGPGDRSDPRLEGGRAVIRIIEEQRPPLPPVEP